jgi:hypothetical protein
MATAIVQTGYGLDLVLSFIQDAQAEVLEVNGPESVSDRLEADFFTA